MTMAKTRKRAADPEEVEVSESAKTRKVANRPSVKPATTTTTAIIDDEDDDVQEDLIDLTDDTPQKPKSLISPTRGAALSTATAPQSTTPQPRTTSFGLHRAGPASNAIALEDDLVEVGTSAPKVTKPAVDLTSEAVPFHKLSEEAKKDARQREQDRIAARYNRSAPPAGGATSAARPSVGGSSMKRLQKELAEMTLEPIPGVTTDIINDNLSTWRATIEGPAGSPYAGGKFNLQIVFPENYPFKAPAIQFETPIYHCNISAQGHICLDILKNQWSPALTIGKVLLSLMSLLTDPNPESDDPLVGTIANLYRSNRKKHDQLAAQWTKKHAKKT